MKITAITENALSLLLHTHIPDTSAESLLQINLFFKIAVKWTLKAVFSVRHIMY
jgi:hypothetical protein